MPKPVAPATPAGSEIAVLLKKKKPELIAILDSLGEPFNSRDTKQVLAELIVEIRAKNDAGVKSPPSKPVTVGVKTSTRENIFQRQRDALNAATRALSKSPPRSRTYGRKSQTPLVAETHPVPATSLDFRLSSPPSPGSLFRLPKSLTPKASRKKVQKVFAFEEKSDDDEDYDYDADVGEEEDFGHKLPSAVSSPRGRQPFASSPNVRGKSPFRKLRASKLGVQSEAGWMDGFFNGFFDKIRANLWAIVVVIVAVVLIVLYRNIDWSWYYASTEAKIVARRLADDYGRQLCNGGTGEFTRNLTDYLSSETMSEPSMQKLVVDSLKEIEQISVKNATEESVPTVEIITINDPSFARRPFMCVVKLFIAENQTAFLVALGAVVVLLAVFASRYQQRRRKKRIENVVNEVYTLLRAQKSSFLDGTSNEAFVSVLHARDCLASAPPKDVWDEALEIVRNNSSITERGAYIAGAQHDVLEWIAPLANNHPYEAFRSPTRDPFSPPSRSRGVSPARSSGSPATVAYPLY